MLLDEIKTNQTYKLIKRRALDREIRCLEPASEQVLGIHDDDG